MCAIKFVINQLCLGNRELGWELWNGKEVVEMTGKQIRQALEKGEQIYGLVWAEDGSLKLDETGFFTSNVMKKIHIGKLVPFMDREGCMANIFYTVTGTQMQGKDKCYEVISSRFEHAVLPEAKVQIMLEMGVISSGAKLIEGKIVLPDLYRISLGADLNKIPEEEPKLLDVQKTDLEKKADIEQKPKTDTKK